MHFTSVMISPPNLGSLLKSGLLGIQNKTHFSLKYPALAGQKHFAFSVQCLLSVKDILEVLPLLSCLLWVLSVLPANIIDSVGGKQALELETHSYGVEMLASYLKSTLLLQMQWPSEEILDFVVFRWGRVFAGCFYFIVHLLLYHNTAFFSLLLFSSTVSFSFLQNIPVEN